MAYTFVPLLVEDDFNIVSDKFQGENDKLDNAIRLAQEERLKQFLGDPLWLQLIENYQDGSIYQDLWLGKQYKNGLNQDVQFFGIKQYLIWITLHIYFKPEVENVGTGFAISENENSENDLQEQRKTAKQYYTNAKRYREETVKFLDSERTIYTLWNGDNQRKWAGSIY